MWVSFETDKFESTLSKSLRIASSKKLKFPAYPILDGELVKPLNLSTLLLRNVFICQIILFKMHLVGYLGEMTEMCYSKKYC